MNWDDFRLVRAIAEARSLVGAADALGVNHSTVFRRLAQIETDLGRALFERSRTAYATTPAGDEMVALANSMADGVSQFERRMIGQDDKPRGELRVTTTDSIYWSILAPVVQTFTETYPDIKLSIDVSSVAANLSRREADIAVRAAIDPAETLIGRRIAQLAGGVYAKEDSVHVRPAWCDASARYIGYAPPIDDTEAARWLNRFAKQEQIALRVNSVLMAQRAAMEGIGLAILPRMVGDLTPGLKRLSTRVSAGTSLWLLTHADLKNSARVRAFMDHAWAQLSRQKALISGED
ncbi:MAG: LysR family transcriptional regulator [Hyphomicrobiales bacterium]|nr:LysR family transcriptional regulator [Hyphomicrobiales bacterium]